MSEQTRKISDLEKRVTRRAEWGCGVPKVSRTDKPLPGRRADTLGRALT
jgi:hypothetical protein